ncbi:hypothetical protein [Paraburkholderia youngii]|uniref:hypothetical protein n=1 Tax=Paraburkholderia youngii TaxID=2782701 RepID=UPI003D2295E4
MNNTDNRFWPYTPHASLKLAALLFVVLFLFTSILRATLNWPSAQSETVVFIGLLLVGFSPVLLAVLDMVIERGAVVEYAGVRLDFSRNRTQGVVEVTVPPNIGVPGVAVTDSGTSAIIGALTDATRSDVIVIDLEEGQAWWETRLLVLLEGATRLGRPGEVVFVATVDRTKRRYQGWGRPAELLLALERTNPIYETTVQTARAASAQWDQIEPHPGAVAGYPPQPLPAGPLAVKYAWMATDARNLRNPLLTEQILQSELGMSVEQPPPGSPIVDMLRCRQLFGAVLYNAQIDLDWPAQQQLHALLSEEAPFFAITRNGVYTELVSKPTLQNEVLKSLVGTRGDERHAD